MRNNKDKNGNLLRQSTLLLFFASLLLQYCTKDWDEHYSIKEESVKGNLWDAIRQEPDYSLFVSYMQKYKLDSVFNNKKPLTIFIPPNESLGSIPDTGNVIPKLLAYHISPSVYLLRNVTSEKKLLTSSGKYASLLRTLSGYSYDEIAVTKESPLYSNGKYYEITNPAIPKPNLYEVTELYSQVLTSYIDLQDSVFLDLKASRPIGFDDFGNTIYDSVLGTVNLFEKYYFPVKKEFRDKYATFILFTQEQYESALDVMISRLGGNFTNREDIPQKWQYEVLIPEALKAGLFDGQLEYSDLSKGILKSITGDTVVVPYDKIDPLSRFECSNGLVYYYNDFQVPLNLYLSTIRVEGESLLDSIGAERFAWKQGVKVTGAIVSPVKSNTQQESLVNVDLGRNYSGLYTVEFSFKDVWPTKYRLVWRANYRPSGLYAVYINNEKIGQFDTYNLRNSVVSVTGERFTPSANGFNRKDFWVENITDFGDVKIRFEYLGKGGSATNGFNIDYVELIPASN